LTAASPWAIERLESCASTMDEAKARARAGAPDGTVVVAAQQTGGRGTRGRAWHAPAGGLYLSMVLREVRDPHLLTMALGNAVADALEVAGLEPRLKWVNDVMSNGKKVAGILAESESTGAHLDFIIAGIGVNVNGHASHFPAALRAIATTLEDELACESCIPDLEALVLDACARWIGLVREGRTREVLEQYRARDALPGALVRIEADGKPVEGTAEGIDDQGRLLVRSGGVQHAHATGTVQLL
jgi:BirA family transcriptional regulator, biotin operon repressor / biotin---[acetyl-CoA-carboxylase] ligase